MPMMRKVNKDFFKTWTPDMAYVLGFFAADGYITMNKRGSQYWSIQIADKDLLESIRSCIGSDHRISAREKKGFGGVTYRLQIGSKEMCDDLHRLGFWLNKTNSIAVPFVPSGFIRDFIRGFFDGDGNIWTGMNNRKTSHASVAMLMAFTSCSRRFLEQIQASLADILGVRGSLFSVKTGCHRLQFSRVDSLKIYSFMYNGLTSPLFLGRKRAIFEKFITIAAVAQR